MTNEQMSGDRNITTEGHDTGRDPQSIDNEDIVQWI